MLSTYVLEHIATCVYFFMRYYGLCTPIFGFDFNMLFLCLFYAEINAPKTKGKGNSDPFTIRLLVHRIRDHEFSQDRIGWIEEVGFGALLVMSEFSIPVKLIAWIVKHIDVDLREFRLKRKVTVFDKQLVCNILGVPSGEEPVKLTSTIDQYEAFQKIREPFMDGFKGKWPKCMEVLTKPKDKDSFLRAFMLLALGSVLCLGIDNATASRYLYNL